jgi:hypothetical protein
MVTLFWLGLSACALDIAYRLGYNTGYDDALTGAPHYFRDGPLETTDDSPAVGRPRIPEGTARPGSGHHPYHGPP